MADVQALEEELERLRVRYEQYFLGIERREPAEDRKTLARKIRRLAETYIPNTAVRFRAQQLKGRLVTYENYWNRVLREIEEGTYRRHLFKVKLHEQMAQERAQAQRGGGGVVDLSAADSPYADVIEAYQAIQRKRGERPVSAEKLARLLERQAQQLRAKFGADVQFRVVEENGKPKLKARPVRK